MKARGAYVLVRKGGILDGQGVKVKCMDGEPGVMLFDTAEAAELMAEAKGLAGQAEPMWLSGKQIVKYLMGEKDDGIKWVAYPRNGPDAQAQMWTTDRAIFQIDMFLQGEDAV